jgi:predicted ATP-grasp superfamily ATP-dependent carboligase
MDITQILSDLTSERNKLDQAIQALEGSLPRRGRPPKSSGKRTMSADARRRIGLAMKLAWAKRKGKSAPKKTAKKTAAKKPARKPMSPAMKKKMSALMKARWAEKKKAGATSL